MEYPEVPIEYQRVGFGKRLLAFIIDGLTTGVLSAVMAFSTGTLFTELIPISDSKMADIEESVTMLSGLLGVSASELSDMFIMIQTASVLGMIISVAYSMIELFTGRSPGKMVMNIEIKGAYGEPGSLNRWFPRWLVKESASLMSLLGLITAIGVFDWVSNVAGFAIFIGCLMVLGQKRQALHDMVAGTAVFER
jgi:uncharacterized RDD family membrane protein YckC